MSHNPRLTNHQTTTETYTYDANGNRATTTVRNKHYEGSYTLDDNLIVYGDNTYRYDDDGYLIEKVTPDGTSTYTYNTLGALMDVNLPDGTQIHYTLDPLNRRIAKEVNGTITQKYLWQNLTTLLAIYDKDDNLLQRFEYAGQRMPVAMTDANGKKYYLHYDQVGSLRAVSDTEHRIVKEVTYDTYGNIISDSNPGFQVPFGFAGGLYDRDTKLVHFGFREYDPFTGKWTAKDPLLFGGGDSNLYGYVLGDPVDFVDPMGLYKHHGNWCGPNWTGGYKKPWDQLSPYEQSHTAPPLDPIDNCCKKHDKCYAKCREKKCDDDVKECQRRCDQKLCRCSLHTKGDKYGIPQYMCISGGI